MTTISLATNYILAVKECRELDAEIKKRKEERDQMEAQLLQAFIQEGVQSIKTAEGMAYMRRDLWASLIGSPNTLVDTPLDWLIKPSVNQQSLSSAVREYPRDELSDLPILPEEVKELIKVVEVFKIRVRP